MRLRGDGFGLLVGLGYRARSHVGTSKHFSLGLFEAVKLKSIELSSVDRCSSSSSSWGRTCTPSKEEANGCSAILSEYTIVHDVILMT